MAGTMHMHHPWFRLPTLKRKSAYIYDDTDSRHNPSYAPIVDEGTFQYDEPLGPSKRRRCEALERGLAQLSLAHPFPQQAAPAPAPLSWNTPVAPTLTSEVSVERHSIVTEPEDIPIECDQDVEPSWYEPEKDRIIITKLDDEDDDQTHPSLTSKHPIEPLAEVDPTSVSISPALLDRLKSQHQNFGIPGLLQGPPPSRPPPSPADESKALVLFKPLAIPAQPTIHEPEQDDNEEEVVSAPPEDADMMDVEML
ncbi:hypothetical protein BXZ70DRAFT_577383 [Cristinia sonorae]|uniref:Uncharacterized protein n=1 Tax=Cristinia sonorae TaxID=1940300 RepID=A0A8K0UFX3_9AGAR|nr:hypothetical protein BXZ70DRAFT_577383 [Cristinia sonorae]